MDENHKESKEERGSQSSLRSLREIRERIVTLLLDPKEALRTDMVSAIAKLLEGIETGDLSFIDAALANLGVDRGHKLFNRVGNLARSLHTSLHELKEHLARENYSINTTNIPEATDKLERIIEMTFSAADRTFRLMDLQTETLKKIKVELDTLEGFISSSDAEKLSIHTSLKNFIEQQRVLLQELAKNTLDIVVAQEYQDLMEQTLRKVIKLLGSIEGQLLSLLSLFSLDPGSEKTSNSGQELNQDKIDSLLRKFGF